MFVYINLYMYSPIYVYIHIYIYTPIAIDFRTALSQAKNIRLCVASETGKTGDLLHDWKTHLSSCSLCFLNSSLVVKSSVCFLVFKTDSIS